jgi:ornithine cyclodeaminase
VLRALWLNQDDLIEAGLTDFDFVGRQLEAMFRLHAEGAFTQPPSLSLKRPERPHVADRIIAMAAHLGGDFDVEGMKWVASAHENPSRGLPRANAVLVLNDPETRVPLCIMEGTLISAVRTAVVQAIACRVLAREKPATLGLVGCGRIGGLILTVLRAWFPGLRRYSAFDTDANRLDAFRAHLAKQDVPVHKVARFEDALSDADIGIVATTAEEAYVPPDCFKNGSLFLNVSLMDPTFEFVLASDKIVVDDWIQSTHSNRVLGRMVKESRLTRNDLHAELGEILAGRKPGRESSDERIFWNPFGMAIEDLAVAAALYRRAEERGLGTPLSLRDGEWPVLF